MSLLDLPRDVRHHIYYFAGLHQSCPILLAGHPAESRVWLHELFNDVRLSIPTSIFRICRHVSIESLAYFYGQNRFQIFCHDPSDLNDSVLRDFSPLALTSIKSLLVQVNRWPTHGMYGYARGITFPDDSRVKYHVDYKDMMKAWKQLCKYLSTRILPDQLRLTVICDTREDLAEEVFQKMRILPPLANCNIRLAPFPNLSMESQARVMVQTLMRPAVIPRGTFRFFELPLEIRNQILKHTHLNPGSGKFASQSHCSMIREGRRRPFGSRQCCETCSGNKLVCCCSWSKAAFSMTCSCLPTPTNIFLVCKQMKWEAEHIFLSSNRLDLEGDISKTVEYLEGLDERHRRSIRHVRILFSEKELDAWSEGTRNNWRVAVNYIKSHLNLSQLCLVVDLRGNWGYPCMDQVYDEFGEEDEERYVTTYKLFCEIGIELVALRGLKDLHVQLSWFAPLEELLEREVMGPDYDSCRGNRFAKEPQETNDLGPQAPNRLPKWHDQAWKTLLDRAQDEGLYSSDYR